MFFHCWHRDCDGNELMSSVVCETTTDDRLSKLNLYELEIMTRVWSVIRVCSVVISQDGKTQQKTDVSPVSTVSFFSYLHGFTFFLRQSQVHVGKKTNKKPSWTKDREVCEEQPIWNQSLTINLRDCFDYSVPEESVWAAALRSFRGETHSVPFNQREDAAVDGEDGEAKPCTQELDPSQVTFKAWTFH